MKTAALRSSDRRTRGTRTLRIAALAGLFLSLGLLLTHASDPVAERARASQDAPEFREFMVFFPDTQSVAEGQQPVRDGDTVLIHTYWDMRAAYEVSADFRQIDSNGDSAVIASRCPDRVLQIGGSPDTCSCYAIEYQISVDNALQDASYIPVPITAYDPVTQLSTTTESVHFCLYNDLLAHRWTRVIGDTARFIDRDGIMCYRVRPHDPIKIQTSWARRNNPMAIRPDFLPLDRLFTINDLLRVEDGIIRIDSTATTATYEINYTLSYTAWSDNGDPTYPIPVTIKASDSACGVEYTTVYFEMDIEAPDGAPQFSPPLPTHVISATLPIQGTAPEGAVDVLVDIEHLDADNPDSTSRVILECDQNRHFAGEITLVPGANHLSAYARDVVANASDPTEHTVKYLLEASISIPQPFRPGDSFVFDTPAGWSRAEVEIYNLEGDRIRSWTQQGTGSPLYEVSIPWDGGNGNGEQVRQGPYLLRCRMADSAGRTAMEEVKAFVLQK